jgi:hypothetical protein
VRRPRQRLRQRRPLQFYHWGFVIHEYNDTKHKLDNLIVLVNDVNLTDHVNAIDFYDVNAPNGVLKYRRDKYYEQLRRIDNPDDPALD